MVEGRIRDVGMVNLGIDSKLRWLRPGTTKVEDVAPNGYAIIRAQVKRRNCSAPFRATVAGMSQGNWTADRRLREIPEHQAS